MSAGAGNSVFRPDRDAAVWVCPLVVAEAGGVPSSFNNRAAQNVPFNQKKEKQGMATWPLWVKS
jgi:hypothetical protein